MQCSGDTHLSVSCSSVRTCSSCAGRRYRSRSHELLLRGQSDQIDRDPAATGRGSNSNRGHRNLLHILTCMLVHLYACLQETLHKRHTNNWNDQFVIPFLSSLTFHNLGCVVSSYLLVSRLSKKYSYKLEKALCSTFILSLKIEDVKKGWQKLVHCESMFPVNIMGLWVGGGIEHFAEINPKRLLGFVHNL